MKRLTRLFAVAMTACFALTAQAQEANKTKYQRYPYAFVGVQGGVQAVVTDHSKLDKVTKPIGALSLGAQFTPVVGLRLNGQGWQSCGHLKSIDKKFNYKYATGDLDLLVNLSNLVTGNEHSFLNLILIGGVGLSYAWDNKDLPQLSGYTEDNLHNAWGDNLLSHNFRAGLQLDIELGRNLSINGEVGANSLSDRFNCRTTNSDDWQLYAVAGISVKFGHKKVKVVEAAPVVEPEPVWETRVDTIWYDETAYKDIEIEETITRNVMFPLRGADAASSEQLKAIAEFVKSHTGCKVDVKSYADKGTGKAKSNMKYSEQRRKGTVDALVENGVPAEIITSAAFGDTVQPFEKNDDNRVSIVTATGKVAKKEPYKVRKFRTEERRVRVQ